MSILKTLTYFQNHPTRCLLAFLALLGVVRITLLGSGGCALGDEFRYWYSAQMLLAASKMEFAGALSPMFDTAGRPGLAIVQLPPILLQSIVFKMTGLDPRSVDSLWIPQIWNIGITLLCAWFFFKNGVRSFGFSEKKSAWLTVVFCLLTGSNFYVRHLLSYDVALCFLLFLLLKINKKNSPIFVGFLTAFGYSIYPGYWPIGFAIFLLYFIDNQLIFDKNFIKKLFKKTCLIRGFSFVFGFFLLIIFYEILARISGKSFIENSLFGGQEFLHFLQLPFDGGLAFFADYLWSVEGFGGVILGIGAMLFWVLFLTKNRMNQSFSRLEIFTFALLLAFLFQSSMGYFSGMKVFYGRLFKQFMPALIWMSAVIFEAGMARFSFILKNKNWIKIGVLSLFLTHFTLFFIDFQKIGYPRDVLNDLGFVQKTDGLAYDIRTKTPPDDGLKRVCEFEPTSFFTMPPVGQKKVAPLDLAVFRDLIFVNFSSLPVPNRGAFQPIIAAKMGACLVSKPHFGAFAPYVFEEDPTQRRAFLGKNAFEIRIFQNKN